ncbi:MAG: ATP-binding protein [Magnetovibrio sp.]|nr:ATP-binding protein [Magnetovibrio sp.]
MPPSQEIKHRTYGTVMLAFIWTASVVGLFVWNNHLAQNQTNEMARQDAINAFNKDQALRSWATSHGGVYLEVRKNVEPSPYMEHIFERDVITDSGRLLTLVNPAAIVGQIMDEYADLYGVQGRLVSATPLNPRNEADTWEVEALGRLETGSPEVTAFTHIGDKSYYRLIRPMVATQACLKCHGFQGYEVGDVLGGVGVQVPMATYEARFATLTNGNALSHSLTWILGFIGLMAWHVRGIRGVRARQAARDELTEAYNSLEILVKERTEQLYQAKKGAEAANTAKSKFLASMSHELRTPLNAIIGFSDLMQLNLDGNLTKEQQDYIADIHFSGTHLHSLINEILELAKIESGEIRVHIDTVNARDVLSQSISANTPMLEKKNISLKNACADMDIPLLATDENRLRQIFINLISNAIKYNDQDGDVVIESQPSVENMWRFSITNTGPGIPTERQNEIFMPFHRLSENTHKIEGSGIGLTIVHQLVMRLGGDIEFSSTPGETTTFWFELPIAEENYSA